MVNFLLITLTILLCGTGILLSALGFSGTWMILLSALITFFAAAFPNIGTLIAFSLLCIGTEALEALAGWLGVRKKGGGKAAGLAAVVGGLIGGVIGSALFPIIGTLLGMLTGSFALAFAVEWKRLKHHGQAAKIASGALLARLTILFLKTVITLAMSTWLVIGMVK